MRLEYLIMAAVSLDLLFGDPRWLPHPVRFIAMMAVFLEKVTLKLFRSEYFAGGVTTIIALSVTGGVTSLFIYGARMLHPVAGHVASALVLYTTFAAKDLAGHSKAVQKALDDQNLDLARKKVAMIVGRDTETLNETDTARAVVETVAENTVDGLTAPLFFAVLFGPVGAMVYKAANTLDSTFGYKNEKYIRFGWCPAKFDDLVNYVPARLTAVSIAIAAIITGMNAKNALRILIRDGGKHPSPNAGLCEAAMAGALNIQLGGMNYYFGKPSEKPLLGEPGSTISPIHIKQANTLMFVTYFICLMFFIGIRIAVINLIAGYMYGY
jgi:adenosylcobinamide-phosphate synthase